MELRKATHTEIPLIWDILKHAIQQRKKEGSQQWQNGYPNEKVVTDDINNDYGHVLIDNNRIVAYVAIIFDIEPVYNDINGEWLTNGEYIVVHRVATSNALKGKGIATLLFQMIEELCIAKKVFSIKVDTNFDNIPMLKIMDKLGYTYCGEVFFSGASRMAFEKVIPRN